MTGDVDPRCARKVHLLLVSFLVCIIAVCRQSTVALCNLSLSAVGSVCSCILHRVYLTGWVSIVRGWGELSGIRVFQSTLGQHSKATLPCSSDAGLTLRTVHLSFCGKMAAHEKSCYDCQGLVRPHEALYVSAQYDRT